MQIPDLAALIASGAAILGAVANFLFSLKLNRQRAELDERMTKLTAEIEVVSKEQSAAVAGQRAQLERELAEAAAAIAATQRLKDALHTIEGAIAEPRTAQRNQVMAEFGKARGEVAACYVPIATWLPKEEVAQLHNSKNQALYLAGRLHRQLEGDRLIEGAPIELTHHLTQLITTLDRAQEDLRTEVRKRQHVLNSGLRQ